MEKIELLIRKKTLKDMELWIYEQYLEIDKELAEIDTRGENG